METAPPLGGCMGGWVGGLMGGARSNHYKLNKSEPNRDNSILFEDL